MKPLSLLPEGPPARLLALALNAAMCAGILSRSALDPLQGKTVCLEVADLGVRVRLACAPNGFRVDRGSAPPDVTVRASALDFVALALRREDPDTLFFTRRLVITGDTDLGLAVKNALDAIEPPRLPLFTK